MYHAIKGVYDDGKIEFLEPVPDTKKAKVIVLFESEGESQADSRPRASESFSFKNLQAFGMWESNDNVEDDLALAKELREQWDRAN